MLKNHFKIIILSFVIIFSFSCKSKSESIEKTQAQVLINYLLQNHVSENQFDDKISERTLNNLISKLDPLKIYLLDKDITEFNKHSDTIDDDFKKKNYEVLESIIKIYLKRFNQRMDYFDTLMKKDFDFTIDEYLQGNRDDMTYAKSEKELNERWRKYVKFQMLNYINIGKSQDEAKEKVKQRIRILKNYNSAHTESEMFVSFVNAVAMALDPHSYYFTPQDNQDFKIAMELKLSGIGAVLRSEDGFVFVESIIKGGPVSRMQKDNALKIDDKIIAVAQGNKEPEDIIDVTINDAVKLIRGEKGTTVRLTVIRTDPTNNKQKRLIIPIVRDEIVLEEQALKYEVEQYNGNKIGYITLPGFYSPMGSKSDKAKSSAEDVKNAIIALKKKNVDTIVFDIRGNSGGSLPEAVTIAGFFIKSGPILQVKSAQAVQPYPDTDPSTLWEGPLVVLVDKFSASASEIFAGAMRDYKRALIVGPTETYGKGTVQTYRELQNKGAIKITIQIFYQPDGTSNNKEGIKPHIIVPSYVQFYDIGENKTKYSLDWAPIPKAEYYTYENKYTTPFLIASLKQKSKSRIKTNKNFQKLLEDIKDYKSKDKSNMISLMKDSEKEIEDSKTKQEEYQKNRKKDNDNEKLIDIKNDFFMKEVFDIIIDYNKALGK